MAIAVKGTIKRLVITTPDNGVSVDIAVTYTTDLGGATTIINAAPFNAAVPMVASPYPAALQQAVDDFTITSGDYTATLAP